MDTNTLDQFQRMDLIIELSEDLLLTKFISPVLSLPSDASQKLRSLRDLPIPEPSLSGIELILSSMRRDLKFLGDIPFVINNQHVVFSIVAYKPGDKEPISLFGHHVRRMDKPEKIRDSCTLLNHVRFQINTSNEFNAPEFWDWLGTKFKSASIQALLDFVVYESDLQFLSSIHRLAEKQIQKKLLSIRRKDENIYTLDFFYWKEDNEVHGIISGNSIYLGQAGMLSTQQVNLHAVINSLNDAFVLVGSDLKILLANEYTLKYSQELLGKQPRIGDSIMNFMAEDKRSAFLQNFARALEGERIELEEELHFPNGKSRWFSIRYLPIYDSSQQLIGVGFASTDIQESKEKEKEIEEKQSTYQLLAEQMRDLVALHKPDGTFEYVSPSYSKVTGYSENELLGINAYAFFHPDDIERIQEESHKKALSNHLHNRIVFRFKHKNGHYIWLETLTEPISNENDEVIQLLTSSRDVTKRIEIKQQLEADQILLQKLSESVLGIAFSFEKESLDDMGRLLNYKGNLKEILGIDTSLGFNNQLGVLWSKVHPDDIQAIQERVNQSFIGLTDLVLHYRSRSSSNSYRNFIVKASPVQSSTGGVIWHGYLSDITSELEIRSSLDIMSLVAEKTRNSVLICNLQGKITHVNAFFSELTGYSLAECLGKKPGALLQGPDTAKTTVAEIRNALQAKSRIRVEILNYTKSGKAYWNDLSIEPYFDQQTGDHLGYFSIQMDITEKVEREKLILQEKEKAERYLSLVKTIVLGLDRNGAVRLINKEGCSLLGMSEAEILGRKWFSEFIPPELKRFLTEAHDNLQSENTTESTEYENEILLPNGERRLISWSNVFFPLAKDNEVFSLSSGLDITESRHAKTQLEEQRTYYQSIFNNSVSPIFLANDDMSYVDVNPAACDLLGFSKDELLNMKILDLVVEDGEAETYSMWEQFIDNGNLNGLVKLKKKNGEAIICEYRAVSDVQPGIHMSILTDITKSISVQQKLKEQNERLKNISWMQSHEMRAPVARMIGLIELYQQDHVKDNEKKLILDYIMDSAKETDKIIHEIIGKAIYGKDNELLQ